MIHECKNKLTVNDNLKKKKGWMDEWMNGWLINAIVSL